MVDQPGQIPDHRARDSFPIRLQLTPRAEAWQPGQSGSPSVLSRRAPLIVGVCIVVIIAAAATFLSSLQWTGPHRSPLALQILRVQIIGGAVPIVIYTAAALLVAVVLARSPTTRRVVVGITATIGGAILGGVVLIVLGATNALGVSLSATTSAWTVVGFAGMALAAASLWSSPGWRTITGALALVFVLLAGTVGINADFGLDPTVGALAGLSTLDTVKLPAPLKTPHPVPTALHGGALWANWHPPADMPSTGQVSQVVIPNTLSGFKARPAGLYLPPAALVKDPPELPFMIMMMGQPGNPDPAIMAAILNVFASRNHGLAPIMLVVDQIGNLSVDPLCLDTPEHGKAQTYVTQDAVNWARANLRILPDPAHWTVAGYSNGGECALAFGATFPKIFGNVLDISGEAYPGSDKATATLWNVFHGDRAQYHAAWPVNILASGTYPDTTAIFTVSSNDYEYLPGARAVNTAASAAHWHTTYYEVPNGGHVLAALNGGFVEGCQVLYPRLGLTEPTAKPTPTPTPTG